MRITVTVKQAGTHKDVLTSRTIDVPDGIGTLEALLVFVVTKSVSEYNRKHVDADLAVCLTGANIARQAGTGKVGFFRRVHAKQADASEAVRNALQCFSDGLYRVFLNSEEITDLSQKLEITDGASLVFVRMTMLAGRLW